jgi:hypothetical protein
MRLLASLGLGTALVLMLAPAALAAPLGKVYVCKYVGTPGADERLQTGQNPIEVSINAIRDYAGVGSYFDDAQGRSYVLATVPQDPEPSASDCPGGEVPSPTPTETPTETPTPVPTSTDPTPPPSVGGISGNACANPQRHPNRCAVVVDPTTPTALALTGSSVTGPAISMGILAALGLGLLWLGRRRSDG